MRISTVFALFPVLLLMSLCSSGQDSLLTGETRDPLIRSSVLPVDEAFAFTSFIEATDNLILLWEIRDGYYLYRQSITAQDENGTLLILGTLPEGEALEDEYFGKVSVYYDRLLYRSPLTVFPSTDNAIEFTLQYQGCAKDRYCYPMQVKTVSVALPQ